MAIHATDDYVTVSEAAEILHVGTSTIRRWIREERIPAYRLGQRRIYLKRADLSSVIAPIRPRTITIETDIERARARRLTEEEKRRGLAAIERLRQLEREVQAGLNGRPSISALQLLHEARAERDRELEEAGLW